MPAKATKPTPTFAAGDDVEWPKQSRTHTKDRSEFNSGTVVGVVPRGKLPHETNKNFRGVASTVVPRNHESYVVYSYGRLYWPRTTSLTKSRF